MRSNKFKWLYIAGFVVVVGLVVGGGFWWRNNQKGEKEVVSKEEVSENKMEIIEGQGLLHEDEAETETKTISNGEINISDWKEYRSANFGFNFKYPSSWKLSEESYKNNIRITIIKNPILSDASKENAVLMIQNNHWEHGAIGLTLSEKRKVIIDEIETILSQYASDYYGDAGLLLINFNDRQMKPYGIEFRPSIEEVENDLLIFEKFISSLESI